MWCRMMGWWCRADVPLVEVNIGLLADQVAVAATDTLDLSQGVHDLDLAIDLYEKTPSATVFQPCMCSCPPISSATPFHPRIERV